MITLMRFDSSAQVDELVAAWRDTSLPAERWTHHAHLVVALDHVLRTDAETALAQVREGIRRLSAAHGVPESPTRGYHETITRFYMWAVAKFVACTPSIPRHELANRLIEQLGDKRLPLHYYSEARLMSFAARIGWLEPDLAPLDTLPDSDNGSPRRSDG
jgi:hypothetical protein